MAQEVKTQAHAAASWQRAPLTKQFGQLSSNFADPEQAANKQLSSVTQEKAAERHTT
jgi:hypothetical protein